MKFRLVDEGDQKRNLTGNRRIQERRQMAWWPEHRETVKMERNYTKFKSNCNLKARKKEILKSNKKKFLS